MIDAERMHNARTPLSFRTTIPNEVNAMAGTCEDCAYSVFDDTLGEYVCEAYLDEDEFYRLTQTGGSCPYYRPGDDYALVRHQN